MKSERTNLDLIEEVLICAQYLYRKGQKQDTEILLKIALQTINEHPIAVSGKMLTQTIQIYSRCFGYFLIYKEMRFIFSSMHFISAERSFQRLSNLSRKTIPEQFHIVLMKAFMLFRKGVFLDVRI